MASTQPGTTTTTPPTPKVDLVAQCLCKAQTFTTRVPSPSSPDTPLPLKATYCHCTSCRHTLGTLYSASVVWPGFHSSEEEDVEPATAGLRRYRRGGGGELLFCGVCSSPMFYRAVGGAGEVEYGVFLGVLRGYEVDADGDDGIERRAVTSGLVRPVQHLFLGDTVDGGASCWLKGWRGEDHDGGERAKRWLGHRGVSKEIEDGKDWPDVGTLPGADLKQSGDGEIVIRCHCGGVNLVFRAAEAQREYAEEIENNEELPWFVDPRTCKGIGSLDGCNSCTTWSGADIFTWTFALVKHISFPDGGEGFPRNTTLLQAAVEGKTDPRFGTLTFYRSSPDIQRYSCSRCSACVFYALDSRRGMVDIAVGVLSSPDGARAEGMISWLLGGDIGPREDMLGSWRAGLSVAVGQEAEEWRIRRGYPKRWE